MNIIWKDNTEQLKRDSRVQLCVTLNTCACSQVTTKTVAQCVEFYYTYKKHVKIGRSGMLTYGEAEPLDSRTTEEETDHKVSRCPRFNISAA